MNVANRVKRLLQIKDGLDRTIREEAGRPLPDGTRVSALKRAKLRVNDRLVRLRAFMGEAAEGVAETRDRARRIRRSRAPVPATVRVSRPA